LSSSERGVLEELGRRLGPASALEKLVSDGLLSSDAPQAASVAQLQQLWQGARVFAERHVAWQAKHSAWLVEFRRRLRIARVDAKKASEEAKAKKSEHPAPVRLRARLLALASDRPARPVLQEQGCFIWGDVGRGKSLLMDLFVASLVSTENGLAVERRHYHDFSREVHESLHARRQQGAARLAVRLAAKDLARGYPAVLCLDEFQITNIQDAVILRELFDALLVKHGVMVVMTSNRPPEDLYKDGLNHMVYMPPFLRLLKDKIPVCHLDSPTDYRAEKAAAVLETASTSYAESFITPQSAVDLTTIFQEVAGGVPTSSNIKVAWGRQVPCDAHNGVALFNFKELCGKPLSADDYSAMVDKNALHTFIVEGVPRFGVDQHNEARRFTNFVDCLYERQCRLLCSADAPLGEVMQEMEVLSHVPLHPQPAMGIAGSDNAVRQERKVYKHGDVTFEVGETSPCRPDTFATAEADAEAGTGGELEAAIRVAKAAASGTPVDPTDQDCVAGVMRGALVSLQESGFAAKRCISRIREMGTPQYQAAHGLKYGLS